MANPTRAVNVHKQYHAHVYFDKDTLLFASELCTLAGQKFGLRVGRIHQKLVGPHTMWSCQILFRNKDFDTFIPWLDDQRGSLSVLVHAVSGDDLIDHTKYAYWLGEAVALDLTGF